MSVDRVLVANIRADLRLRADASRAPGMQAYMKSAMPYLGVRVPQVRAIVRAAVRVRPLRDAASWQATVAMLWREAAFREERYAATVLLAVPSAAPLRTPQLIDFYRELIVEGAWWDHVDEFAHRVGELLTRFPVATRPVVHGWRVADDRWLRRVSIICQVGRRADTDQGLLSDAVETNAGDTDFFLRKAIGWALRDYARTDPDWVRAFVAGHELSPLSVREATKHL